MHGCTEAAPQDRQHARSRRVRIIDLDATGITSDRHAVEIATADPVYSDTAIRGHGMNSKTSYRNGFVVTRAWLSSLMWVTAALMLTATIIVDPMLK